jgi:hypothetical protein
MPKYIVAREKTIKVIEFYEVEGKDYLEAIRSKENKLQKRSVISNVSTNCTAIVEKEKVTRSWYKSILMRFGVQKPI